MRGYMLGRKRTVRAAEKVHYDHLSTLVPTAEPFGTRDFSSHAAPSEPWMSSSDHATVDERSRGVIEDRTTVDERSPSGVDDPRDKYDATDFCPSFPEQKESIDCHDGSVRAEAVVFFDGKPYVPEDESTSKDNYHTVGDDREELTESELGEINSWMTEYMEGAFVQHVKGKVEEIKEKRWRKTKGNTKVSFGKTVVETEVEAPSSDLSTPEFKLVLDKMAKLQEEMKHTKIELKRRGIKTVASKPLGSPFVTRENSAFDRWIEV